ncbi:spermatogenesis-associated protein 20 isoform X4 [Manis pentadactyla]|uniref:spermatogenesis-associated protein 20 isoform X4 n=1 Tax=Manis pentadactyla TaxID=143292 RepID=UPI001873EE11|nr:spermatogenesis-associated protein 20 isoform X4 [Manis pentadactyla]
MPAGGKGSRPKCTQSTPQKVPNRLINEKSPYLLQHAYNPVDWYPWGQEAFDKARNENKPIFLSVGYSTCHWCHMMEEESFQNEEIGQLLNEDFVCVKVDREERPDVDKVYMTFVQATSSGGGWPMNVWLTPNLQPFVGGTYFPLEDGLTRVGFRTVLLRIRDKGFHRYSTDRQWHVPRFEKMLYDQGQLAVAYSQAFQISGDEFYADVAKDILQYVSRNLSHRSGGFYSAEDADSPPERDIRPKEGAFYVWTVEEVQQLLPEPVLDATEPLTSGQLLMKHYGLTEAGNIGPSQDPKGELQGQNVLNVRYSLELTAARFGLDMEAVRTLLNTGLEKLFQARKHRPKPHLDTKMLAAWNGLMVSGYAVTGAVLGLERLINCAINGAKFLKRHMFDVASGRLMRTCYTGSGGTVEQSNPPCWGFLEDYAFVVRGLLDLYEASQESAWLEWALRLQDTQDRLFWDSQGGGYFCSEAELGAGLPLRLKDDQDGAEPSANSVSAHNLLRLHGFTGHKDWMDKCACLLTAFSERLRRVPVALPEMICALSAHQQTLKQIVICGDPQAKDTKALLQCVHSIYIPNKVLILADGDPSSFLSRQLPFLSTLRRLEDLATAYVYEHQACSMPITEPCELRKLLHQ